MIFQNMTKHSVCQCHIKCSSRKVYYLSCLQSIRILKWAASWQNQQSECAPSEDSDQPGHPPSLIRVFAVRMKKAWTLSYPLSAQRRLWSDWADAQADLRLHWVHSHAVGFDMRRLKLWEMLKKHLSRDMTKPTKWVCPQRRLRSAWASAQSDQSLCCAFNG